nr:hypothetical protein [Tanacetum cinerariifolium]
GTVPGLGAAFVHLSTLVPAIKEKIEDAEERLGTGRTSISKAQNTRVKGEVVVDKVLTTQAIVVERAQPKTPAAAGAQQGAFYD